MNPDSIRIAIFAVRSADAINPDSIRIEVLVRTHLKNPFQSSNTGIVSIRCVYF